MIQKSVIFAVLAISSSAFSQSTSPALSNVVAESFAATREGFSSDEVLLQDERFEQFLAACEARLPDVPAREFGWTLLNLRKAGKLQGATTRRGPRADTTIQHVAEIAARLMEDQHEANMDRVLCDPKLRREFDRVARTMAPEANGYDIRKTAFALRKARKLRPELVLRVADWNRVITTHALPDVCDDVERIPTNPGVYLFRDATGYLYIGESQNLRQRILTHVANQPASLVKLLEKNEVDLNQVTLEVHAFAPESAAKQVRVRRAYESELIASRRPRFNVRP